MVTAVEKFAVIAFFFVLFLWSGNRIWQALTTGTVIAGWSSPVVKSEEARAYRFHLTAIGLLFTGQVLALCLTIGSLIIEGI